MAASKVGMGCDVFTAAKRRISYAFDHFDKIVVAFSGGKDSSVMLHLVMDEAIARGRKVVVMFIDFEAQYAATVDHVQEMFDMYRDHIDPHWVAMPMLLRNALTNYEPQWVAWDESCPEMWVRDKPRMYKTADDYPFAFPRLEFEEFVVMFAEWYGQDAEACGVFVGIRADESLHRYCSIATWEKIGKTLNGRRWTTRIVDNSFNVYPIYDWTTSDVWAYHAKSPDKPYNRVYDAMTMAGVPLSQQRLCQPFGDDQRRGLWLYQILEPETWGKLVARVNGANSGALYVRESGNVSGYNKITLPEGHTWRSFCNLLLQTMPEKTRDHYIERFQKFIYGWLKRGYEEIPDEAPPELEAKQWAPSWRRMCKVLLRNDYWCKGLGQSQPKSEAWQMFKDMRARKTRQAQGGSESKQLSLLAEAS